MPACTQRTATLYNTDIESSTPYNFIFPPHVYFVAIVISVVSDIKSQHDYR